MGDFQSFALTGKNDRMVTDDVTGTDRAKPNTVTIPRTDPTFAAINRDLRKIPVQRLGHDLPKTKRRARRRVDLVAVVRFNNLDIDAIAQRLGRCLASLKVRFTPGAKFDA